MSAVDKWPCNVYSYAHFFGT